MQSLGSRLASRAANTAAAGELLAQAEVLFWGCSRGLFGGSQQASSSAAAAAAGSSRSSSTLRRVNVKPGSSNGSNSSGAAAAAGASTSGRQQQQQQQRMTIESFIEMGKEVPGGSKPLLSWERWYWGVGVVGVSYLLYSNLKKPDKTPEELEAAHQRALELEAQRKEHLRAALMGQSFIEGETDPLNGLTPEQIVIFMEAQEIDPTDPLEGLTPDEIDAYVKQQEERRRDDST